MKRQCVRWLVAFVLVAAGLAGAASGGDDFKPEAGYDNLFNGKDFTGWRYVGVKESIEGKTETPDKRIEVVGGVIVVNPGKGIKDLQTTKEFNKDFHVKLEFRAAPKADSGVYIRGPQLQVRDFVTVGPYKPKSYKPGDWNELDITVKNNVVITTVNGKPLSDAEQLSVTVRDGKAEATVNGKPVPVGNIQVSVGAVALCKCNGEVIEKAFKAGPKGGIGLQAESGKFEFRRIRLKEMP